MTKLNLKMMKYILYCSTLKSREILTFGIKHKQSNVVRTVTETKMFKKRKADRDNGLQFYKDLFFECFGHAIYKVFNQLFS